MEPGQTWAVLGTQWGDEGKGKLVDILAQGCDIVARCQGGSNAGHTIVVNETKFHFHLLPCGLIHQNIKALIGNGVVIHLPSLFKEIEDIESKGISTAGRIFISDRSHLVFNFHQIVDGLKEQELGASNIGTTRRGIGPTYSAKASRSGIRIHQLFHWESFENLFRSNLANKMKRYGQFDYDVEQDLSIIRGYVERLRPMVVDGIAFINEALSAKKRILIEGANALLLDIDAGTYPYVTSSSCSVGGIITGLCIPPQELSVIIGVMKAYTTRVGGGPFPTELKNEIGDIICANGAEFGTTTGRRRRCGWLDIPAMKHSHRVNRYSFLNLTKLDVLDTLDQIQIGVSYTYQGKPLEYFPADLDVLKEVQVIYETHPGWKTSISECRSFEQLPIAAQNYVRRVQELLQIPIRWIGVGPRRDAIIEYSN
jgi:adenylosuccinate synthase